MPDMFDSVTIHHIVLMVGVFAISSGIANGAVRVFDTFFR